MTKLVTYALLGGALVEGVQFADDKGLSNQTVQFEFPPVDLGPIRNVSNCTDPGQIDWCSDVWCPENGYKFPNQECVDKCEDEQGCCPDSKSATGYSKCSEESEKDDLAKKFYIAEGVMEGIGVLGVLYSCCKNGSYSLKGTWKSILGTSSFIGGLVGNIATAISKPYGNQTIAFASTMAISCACLCTLGLLRKVSNNNPVLAPLLAPVDGVDADADGVDRGMMDPLIGV